MQYKRWFGKLPVSESGVEVLYVLRCVQPKILCTKIYRMQLTRRSWSHELEMPQKVKEEKLY